MDTLDTNSESTVTGKSQESCKLTEKRNGKKKKLKIIPTDYLPIAVVKDIDAQKLLGKGDSRDEVTVNAFKATLKADQHFVASWGKKHVRDKMVTHQKDRFSYQW